MRGKKAKQLRKLAHLICRQKNIPAGKGYNEYDQAYNCVGWKTATNSVGEVIFGPDGMALRQVVRDLPGTVVHAWELGRIYKELKRQWKRRALVL
jgi:hypothetical protein